MAALLSDTELRAIDRLRLIPRRAFSGAVRGERLTARRGVSIEFADYRNYMEGDDLRHVDWNILARLGQAVTKTYRDEEDLCVHLLLDNSKSMEYGTPSKSSFANRAAWALGYMALCGGDTLYPRHLGSARPPTGIRGRQNMGRFARWVEQEAGGNIDLTESLERFLRSNVRSGIVLFISDGMDERLPSFLPAIGARGHDLMFLQVLSEIEIDPDLEGDLRLIDSESGHTVELTANSYAVTEYKRRFAEHQAALRLGCERGGGRYLLLDSAMDFGSLAVQELKRNGWVKS